MLLVCEYKHRLAEPRSPKVWCNIMQVHGGVATIYVGDPVCLGLLSRPQKGSELAGVLLGIKTGPRVEKKNNNNDKKKKEMSGVYCSCGCLEVTGRAHARFVKMNRGQKRKTDKLFIHGRQPGPHLLLSENYTNSINVCALEPAMNPHTYIQNLLKIPFGLTRN